MVFVVRCNFIKMQFI